MSQAKYLAQFKSQLSKDPNNNKIDWSATNPKRIFDLIDTILPLKDCISYQLIPLDLTERHLVLGMINPDNETALKYVRSHCVDRVDSMTSKRIDSKTHQLILSAYSRRFHAQKSAIPTSPSLLQERPTLILDNPEEIESATNDFAAQSARHSASPTEPILNLNHQKSVRTPLDLDLQPKYLSAPPRFLASLPPQLLWQELLARVLLVGNGRIQFERLDTNGRILWSHNGNLKLSIDPIAGQTFQKVLAELKRLVNLPNVSVKKVCKGEIERAYQQERLLLLWRINPSQYGEEATLQVIRGKVLELYQKRQMEELGDQAIQLAEQLELKLEQIHDCRQINPNSVSKLSTLHNLREKINKQINLLS